ncbi:DUF5618 family protein [Rhodoflexus caldus]|uniref:DUF5618 family protein n=1 Tax=Rhodoflexus caldus TaxID=2891236 RepID=UPI00202AADB7|nr:DUF5618 family protein [Rhodoflexus caldus]
MENKAYQEALRYMDNAKESLKNAGKKDNDYADVKYVISASGIAYRGVLLAIDEYLKRKEGAKPASIEEYRTRLSKHNKTLKTLLNSVYDSLHLAGYYHGTTSARTIKHGLEDAYKIINYIKPS